MKSFNLRFLFVFFIVCACSSDDGDGGPSINGADFAGTYALTAITVSMPIDNNDDQTTSSNLLDEVPCLRGTLVLNENFTWSSNAVEVQLISPITGNQYNVACTNELNNNGNWGVENGQLFLVGENPTRMFIINGNSLTENIGKDLPGIRSIVFDRQ